MKQTPITTLFLNARARSGKTIRELEGETGSKRSTIDNHFRHAESMRLFEAIGIANATGMTDAEWVALRKGVQA